MKKILYIIGIMCALVSCSNDDANNRPGLWTATDMIETFPGDIVLVTGQVSNYIGIDKVEITCDAWDIHQVYRLSGKQNKVFDYNFRMEVPKDATFDQELRITVTDIEGTENKKIIPMIFLPDTQAPVDGSGLPWQIQVDFNTAAGAAIYPLSLPLSDDRGLKQAVIDIPSWGYTETVELSGKETVLAKDIVIDNVGNYDMSITVQDTDGNETVIWHQFVVMLAEEEDAISDYPRMWVVNASENASEYLAGYYAPMARQDAYQYQGKFYADKDGYELYIVPEQTMDGALFGASPYVSSKLMNKQGYVVPVKIEKAGYYGLWIDIQNHQWSIWELDTSAAYTGSLTLSGCGFSDFGDWGTPATEMTRSGFRYTQTVGQNGSYSGTRQYYAARVSDWGYILRFWGTPDTDCGWWEDTAGSGGAVGTYESTYDGQVEVTFDTAILWATVKKK